MVTFKCKDCKEEWPVVGTSKEILMRKATERCPKCSSNKIEELE